jgi:hypothetical protein
MKSLDERESESCPPGIGFVGDDRRVLHICPAEDGSALCMFLGPVQADCKNASIHLQYRLLQLFYRRDWESLVKALQAASGTKG